MSLLISYVPEGHFDKPLYAEIPLSESYQEVINIACEVWRYTLPPKHWIDSCRLAHHILRTDGSSQWAILQPHRFVELVRAHKGDNKQLELRLQIEIIETVDESISSFPYDTPSRASSSIHVANPGYFSSFDEFNIFPSEPLRPINTSYASQTGYDQYSDSPKTPTFSTKSSAGSTIMPTAFNKGVTAFLAGDYKDARIQFQKSADEAHEQIDVRREADSLRHLGTTCRHLQEFAAARSHLLAARLMYESLGAGCRQEQLQCIRHLARVEADNGFHKVALVDYEEVLRISAEEGFVTQHAWCSYYLGHLYNRMELYWEARNILKDVVNTSREIQDPEIEGFATEECGYTAEQQGFPQLAMECYQRALAIFREHGEGRWVANENRVKRRMDLLSGGYPVMFNVRPSKKKSIGARLFKSGGVRV